MKRWILLSISLVLAVGIIICFTSVSVKAETQEKISTTAVYDSIKIAQGETLTDIAREYNTSGVFTDSEYIEKIKRINNIYTDTIHAGCYLAVIRFCE